MVNKLLIYINYFYPGINSGGPAKSISNLINLIHKKIDVLIVTKNYDFKSKLTYNLPTNRLLTYKSKAKIIYSSKKFSFQTLKKTEIGFNNVFLCGFFEPYTFKTLFKLIFINPTKKYFILPMGVFSKIHIRQKRLKKRLYTFIFNLFKLYNKITFVFTSKEELNNASHHIKTIPNYIFLPDIPTKSFNVKFKKNKTPSVVFISRIHPLKNLDFTIDILNKLKKSVNFDIYGPIEDKKYWEECLLKLKKTKNILNWKYKGVAYKNVGKIFSDYDLFIFPTKGENFGHVIFEAMSNGCIPVISDRTPWSKAFENTLDFTCDLFDEKCFVKKIDDLLFDFSKIQNLKKIYVSAAKKFYKKTYGIDYINKLQKALL